MVGKKNFAANLICQQCSMKKNITHAILSHAERKDNFLLPPAVKRFIYDFTDSH